MSRYVARMQDRGPVTVPGHVLPVAVRSCGPWFERRPHNALQIRLHQLRYRGRAERHRWFRHRDKRITVVTDWPARRGWKLITVTPTDLGTGGTE